MPYDIYKTITKDVVSNPREVPKAVYMNLTEHHKLVTKKLVTKKLLKIEMVAWSKIFSCLEHFLNTFYLFLIFFIM